MAEVYRPRLMDAHFIQSELVGQSREEPAFQSMIALLGPGFSVSAAERLRRDRLAVFLPSSTSWINSCLLIFSHNSANSRRGRRQFLP